MVSIVQKVQGLESSKGFNGLKFELLNSGTLKLV
jgi:hypothetical protein